MSCFVKDCKNIRRLLCPDSEVTFHRMPKIEERRRQWLSAIGRGDANITGEAARFVCSRHFAKDDFVAGSKLRLLKPTAVPNISLGVSVAMPLMSRVKDNTPIKVQPSLDGEHKLPITISERTGSDCDSSITRERKRVKLEHSYSFPKDEEIRKTCNVTANCLDFEKSLFNIHLKKDVVHNEDLHLKMEVKEEPEDEKFEVFYPDIIDENSGMKIDFETMKQE